MSGERSGMRGGASRKRAEEAPGLMSNMDRSGGGETKRKGELKGGRRKASFREQIWKIPAVRL